MSPDFKRLLTDALAFGVIVSLVGGILLSRFWWTLVPSVVFLGLMMWRNR